MTAAVLTCLMAALPIPQDPAPGIARDLAVTRVNMVRDVEYGLRFTLDERSESVRGEIWLAFSRVDEDRSDPLILDFGGTDLADVTINEAEPDGMRAVNGHLIIPGDLLASGRNLVHATFRSAVAASGTPLTVYRDPVDGREFYYTLVVPADAHRLYPCFDQPDIKAVYNLILDLPPGWTAAANAAETEDSPQLEGGRQIMRFRPTKPISTYLMAFAAGPFTIASIPAPQAPGLDPLLPLRIFLRPSQRPLLDQEALTHMHVAGLRWLAHYFSIPYPFDKLDVVLIPGFPYGGMEHAGAIFYREQSLVFDHPPTDSERIRRSTLIYHELAHQWFGNLVTMRWFDDLWLKEGFATFLAYQCLDELEPGSQSWLRFHQRVKPRAQEIDATPGTTPVYQALQNLADAKSAYGPIVYNKAPAVLRELHERLGPERFREGLRRFLERHAFGAADWRDLAGALEASSGADLERWSDRWLLSPSMPQVRVAWAADDNGVVETFQVHQRPVGDAKGTWPLQLQLLVWDQAGERSRVDVRLDGASTRVAALEGRAAPACVLIDPGAVAYGQFLPDDVSREYLLQHIAVEADPLVRAVATASLFEAVRETELDPLRYSALASAQIETETDPETHAVLLSSVEACLSRYLSKERGARVREALGQTLLMQLEDGAPGRELQTFRFLARTVNAPAVADLCRRVAGAGDLPRGLVPGKADRFLATAALLAAGEASAVATLAEVLAKEDVARDRFLAGAAGPLAATKADYFAAYTEQESIPEQWSQDSLSFFHWAGQEELTLPFLRLALDKVDWVKRNRRIFFLPAWIDAFVNGHSSPEALAIVQRFLAESRLEDDVRNKVLQSLDGLERAVRIRSRWE